MNQEQKRVKFEIEQLHSFMSASLVRNMKDSLGDGFWNKLIDHVSEIESIEYPFEYREKVDDCKIAIFEAARKIIGEDNPDYRPMMDAMSNLSVIFIQIERL